MYLPYESGSGALSEFLTAPTRRTEYVGGSPGVSYHDWLKAGERRFVSQKLSVPPGRTTTVDWLRGPPVPGFTRPARNGAAPDETWYRKGNTLTFSLATVTDPAGHHDLPFPSDITSSHFAVKSGDTTLYESDGLSGGILTAAPERTTYTMVYDQTRTNDAFHQSLTTHSETFSSGRSDCRSVPESWTCATERGECEGPAGCSALPVVVPRYRLDTAPDGTSPTGADHAVVTFGYVPGVTAAPAVTRATVELSFDDGKGWTAASLTPLGEGAFRADWTTPRYAAGRDASLRIQRHAERPR
ncbi:hypothetical protein ACIQ7D_25280 [Streptomyces sp. NPDC096310]|uniref:hypothetical protein n=1 Tax=Streptomyces sp. NPDC096310 TaxID=3366082 RepID=UPI0037FE4EB4